MGGGLEGEVAKVSGIGAAATARGFFEAVAMGAECNGIKMHGAARLM